MARPEAFQPSGGGATLESVAAGADLHASTLETIVREGRPALLIRENRIAPQDNKAADTASGVVIERLMAAAGVLEPLIPLVGRIDVANYPGPLTYVGTGWLVDRNIVVTNSHVADLIARSDSGKFRFRPGRFGEEMKVTLDYRHEHKLDAKSVARVARVIWIESDLSKADIAFLEVERGGDGTTPEFIPLADSDASGNSDVAVIGYPARAPAHIIPDQAWMDRIYGSTYDVKRIAPGLTGANSRGWATHDCTTLGGNSGSAVIDMKTGRAVGLHFAGAFMIENYAVPASTIRGYLKNRPWQFEQAAVPSAGSAATTSTPAPGGQPSAGSAASTNGLGALSGVETRVAGGQVTVTIPLTVTVSLGTPQAQAAAGGGTDVSQQTHPAQPAQPGAASDRPSLPPPRNAEEAAHHLRREHNAEGVYSVWAGYTIDGEGYLTDTECLVVSARRDRVEALRGSMPRDYAGFPVEVRPASVSEMAGGAAVTEAPVTSIKYNDADRTGPGFSFDWVDEEMKVTLHVGPERSWTVLSEFLAGAQEELVSSIYEFHAKHIAEAIEQELDEGAKMTLVVARQSLDPQSGNVKPGDFKRGPAFKKWENTFRDQAGRARFQHVFVPQGAQGLIAYSYHIKVTVRDRSAVWLSSGNWKRSSQPLIDDADLDDPRVTSGAGNREWHAVIVNETLAERFRNHILADFEQSHLLLGTHPAPFVEESVDVRRDVLEALNVEAPPEAVIEPLEINRRVRVKPLLTPDKKGAVFSRAVLRLIRSAERQLLFQNQYISMKGADAGFLKELVDALAEKAQELEDFRVILRSENEELAFDLSGLKKRGLNLKQGESQVRILSSTHTKGIIVDGRQVLIGSQNWSASGVTLNRDASLLFDDEEVAQYYASAFEMDWKRAREPKLNQIAPESVRVAEGVAPPAGFVRMSLSDYLEG
jgi:V8-like Glu-specific endopeptidase